jgi:3-mercaptopyruvate sulfurtransferase SseA
MAHGEIPTTINIPLPNIDGCLQNENEWKNFTTQPFPSKNKELIFTCRSGGLFFCF